MLAATDLSAKAFLILPLGFGAVFALDQSFYLWKAIRSRRWVSTKGKVVSSSVSPVSRFYGDRFHETQPRIVYRFEVDGQSFEGHTLSFIGGPWAEVGTDRFEENAKYPTGRTVTVWFDPDNPEASCLLPGVDFWAFLQVILPLFVAGPSLYLLLTV